MFYSLPTLLPEGQGKVKRVNRGKLNITLGLKKDRKKVSRITYTRTLYSSLLTLLLAELTKKTAKE